jgi:hypothetical protein
VERSDVCVLPAAGVVGEAMVAIAIADAMRIKFGGDSMDEALANYHAYVRANGLEAADLSGGEAQNGHTPRGAAEAARS